jgi:hypothetical protein
MSPGPLVHVLSDAATARPELVLMDRVGYWRIESLIRQARRGQKSNPELGEGRAYSWHALPGSGKIVVYHFGVPAFWEPGAEV